MNQNKNKNQPTQPYILEGWEYLFRISWLTTELASRSTLWKIIRVVYTKRAIDKKLFFFSLNTHRSNATKLPPPTDKKEIKKRGGNFWANFFFLGVFFFFFFFEMFIFPGEETCDVIHDEGHATLRKEMAEVDGWLLWRCGTHGSFKRFYINDFVLRCPGVGESDAHNR